MRTDNKNSGKDLHANSGSSPNTNEPAKGKRFPESHEARGEMKKQGRRKEKKDDDIELLAQDVQGTVSSRETSSDPQDIAGVSDLDQGMKRSRRRR